MSLDALFRTQKFTLQYQSFKKSKLTELANKIVLEEIHNEMRTKKFSEKIIDVTYVKSVTDLDGITDIEIVSDYEEDGFDVSQAREEGTRDHFTGPIHKKASSWIKGGIRFFSKGHRVKGIPAEKIIEKTIQKKSKQLQSQWKIEQDKFFEATVNGS